MLRRFFLRQARQVVIGSLCLLTVYAIVATWTWTGMAIPIGHWQIRAADRHPLWHFPLIAAAYLILFWAERITRIRLRPSHTN
jgi:hypothetical protein